MVVFGGGAVVLHLLFTMLLLFPVFPSLPSRTETQRESSRLHRVLEGFHNFVPHSAEPFNLNRIKRVRFFPERFEDVSCSLGRNRLGVHLVDILLSEGSIIEGRSQKGTSAVKLFIQRDVHLFHCLEEFTSAS